MEEGIPKQREEKGLQIFAIRVAQAGELEIFSKK